MNVEEYRTIRNEMLQRFQSANKLIFFAITSIGALFAWLGTNPGGDPYVFICIGLLILLYLFHTYLKTLQGIYNAGSYLVLFHEDIKSTDEKGFKYHVLSRFISKINDKELKWGYDGVKGAFILLLLILGVGSVPLYFMYPNIKIDDPIKIIAVIIAVFLLIMNLIVMFSLFRLKLFMEKTMYQWISLKWKLDTYKPSDEEKGIIEGVLDQIKNKYEQTHKIAITEEKDITEEQDKTGKEG